MRISWLRRYMTARTSRSQNSAQLERFINDNSRNTNLIQRAVSDTLQNGQFVEPKIYSALIKKIPERDGTFWLEKMAEAKIIPSVYTYGIVLAKFSKKGEVGGVKWILDHMARFRVKHDIAIMNAIIHCFSVAGQPNECVRWLDSIAEQNQRPDCITYSSVIRAFGRAGDSDMAVRFFEKMIEQNIVPNRYHYAAVMTAFAQRGDPNSCLRYFDQMVAENIADVNIGHFNIVLDSFAKAKDFYGAKKFFTRLQSDISNCQFDLVSINTILNCVSLEKDFDLGTKQRSTYALKYFDLLRSNSLQPDTATFNCVLFSFAKDRFISHVQNFFEMAINNRNYKFGIFTFSNIVHGFAYAGDTASAESWFRKIETYGFKKNLFCFNALLDVLAQSGEADKAIYYFDLIVENNLAPNNCSANCVITALGKAGRDSEVLTWMEKIRMLSLEPDATLVTTTSYFCGGPKTQHDELQI